MNKQDIRDDEAMDVIYFMLEHPRKDWYNIIKEYYKDGQLNGYDWDIPIENFKEDFQGKFNIGDYVSVQNIDGIFRISALPYLDIRYSNRWYHEPNNKEYEFSTNFTRIEEFGNSYELIGVNPSGELVGTYLNVYHNGDMVDNTLLPSQSTEDKLTSIDPSLVNKNIVQIILDEIKYRERGY